MFTDAFNPIALAGVCLATLLALSGSANASGKTYRWKDANGRYHYSDVAAPNSQEMRVSTATGSAAKPKAADANATEAKAKNCQSKREQLATYISASKVTETDSLGNAKTYTDAEKEKLVQRTQMQVREACGEG
jgi:hypothetical protein